MPYHHWRSCRPPEAHQRRSCSWCRRAPRGRWGSSQHHDPYRGGSPAPTPTGLPAQMNPTGGLDSEGGVKTRDHIVSWGIVINCYCLQEQTYLNSICPMSTCGWRKWVNYFTLVCCHRNEVSVCTHNSKVPARISSELSDLDGIEVSQHRIGYWFAKRTTALFFSYNFTFDLEE